MFAKVSDKQERGRTSGKRLPASYKTVKIPIREEEY